MRTILPMLRSAQRTRVPAKWLACWLLLPIGLLNPPCDAAKRRFTVADDIGLVRFADPAVIFSPNGRFFAVATERGVLDRNRAESAIRVFRTGDVRALLAGRTPAEDYPAAYWTICRATYQNGPIISRIHWLRNSSGILFLAKTNSGNDQLFLADLSTRAIQAMTPADQDVTAFDVRDRRNFAYTALSPAIGQRMMDESRVASVAAAGHALASLIFPEYRQPSRLRRHDLNDLWAVVNGRHFRVEDRATGRPFSIHFFGQQALALSPSGRSAVTALAVESIPAEWEKLYPPSFAASPYRIRAGRQDLEAIDGYRYVSEYVLIDLVRGQAKHLVGAPIAHATGWWGLPSADWSADGNSVVLANTFLPAKQRDADRLAAADRPCAAAVIAVGKGSTACLDLLKGPTQLGFEPGYHYVESVNFAANDSSRVVIDYLLENYAAKGLAAYRRSPEGTWELDSNFHRPKLGMDVSIRRGLNQPPVLVAADPGTEISREIWDPNPQLKNILLGDVSVFKWKDRTGRDWIGGLYKPPDFVALRKYPMVIQTHGFDESAFSPSGIFPTANAAQELAAAGIIVLQVRDCPIRTTPEEGPCQVRGYEAAVEQLAGEGLVDPARVGIIGFSRTCYYALEALTTSALPFKAASITDGFNEGYLQYILGGADNAHEAEAMVGASPFGEGLRQWIERSPEFNLHKISPPLQIVALGRASTLMMWEPYAALRYLNKATDLVVLNSDEHVLTNPAVRFASQEGTVDWFRFWLKGEEDPDPAKAEQYARWRELRKLQEAQGSEKPN